MGCNTLIEPACGVVGHLIHTGASSAAGGVLGAIAQAIATGVRWVVINTATLWLQIHSPDRASEPAVTHIQQWLLPITAAVAAGGVIAAGARMALTRRANPLIDVTGGLLTLAGATTLGVTIATLLLQAGDAWSAWILQVSTGGQFTHRLELVMDLGPGAAPSVVMIFGIAAIVLSLVQAALMLFRQAALVILAGALPLAAAGAVAPLTRAWVRKVTAWMLALICYKPAAAAVYAAAFTMIGSGRSFQTTLMGFVMLLLSVLTLPALMRFFTWTTGTIGGAGGGGQLLNAVAVGAIATGALRSGAAGSAQEQALHINSALGPPGGGGAGGVPPPGSGPSGPPSPGPSAPGGAGSGGGPAGATLGAAAGHLRRPPSWPGPSPRGQAAGADGAGGTAAGTATTAAAAPTGAADGPPAWPTGTASTAAAGSSGTGATGAAAAGAASGAGPAAAAAVASQAAAHAARLASGAMTGEDQR